MIKDENLTRIGARAVRFGVSGALATAVSYATFMLGLHFWPYWVAGIFSWLVSVCFGFVANRWFTFGIRTRERGGRDFILFAVGAVLQLGIALIGYRILLDSLHLSPTIAFGINLVVTTSFSFIYMSLVAFRRTAPTNDAGRGA